VSLTQGCMQGASGTGRLLGEVEAALGYKLWNVMHWSCEIN
jgi:hypothetical protein